MESRIKELNFEPDHPSWRKTASEILFCVLLGMLIGVVISSFGH